MTSPPRQRRPSLVAVAHGSSDPRAREVYGGLVQQVRHRLPGVDVRLAFLDHDEPTLPVVLRESERPVVVVPLLLHAGVHLRRDIGGVVAWHAPGSAVAATLAPDPRLLDVLVERLAAAGVADARGRGLVLAASGSTDAGATAELAAVADALRERTGAAMVEPAIPAADGVADAVRRLRVSYPQVAVVRWFLAPGRLPEAAAAQAAAESAPCTDVLGAHEIVAALVIARYDEAVHSPSTPGQPAAGLGRPLA